MSFLAEQSPARAFVDVRLVHRHHRINRGNEGGPQADFRFYSVLFQEIDLIETGSRHHQVAARREAHHTHFFRVDFVFIGVFAHPLQGALCVGEHVGVLLATEKGAMMPKESTETRSTIAQHKGRDAVALQPLRHAVTLGCLVEPKITAARTHDNGKTFCVAVGQIRRQRHLLAVRHVEAFPKRDAFLGKGLSEEKQQQTENQQFAHHHFPKMSITSSFESWRYLCCMSAKKSTWKYSSS